MDEDWLQWLRLGLSAAGAAGGAMGGGGAAGLTTPPTPPTDPTGGGLTVPGAGASPLPSTIPLPPPPQADWTGRPGGNIGLPASPPTGQVDSRGFPVLPPTPGAPTVRDVPPIPPVTPSTPSPGGPGTVPASGPIGGEKLAPPVAIPGTNPPPTPPVADNRTWFDRNVADPLSNAWNGKQPKLDANGQPVIGPDGKPVLEAAPQLTDRQKTLLGTGQSIGAALTKAATPAAPAIAAGAVGSAYKPPIAFDAARLSQARTQELAALKAKATLNAPWLQRYQQRQPGLLG